MIESGRDTRHPIIRSGELVDLYDEGGIVCAVVLGEEKGRLRVVTERGKEMRVASSRVALRTGETVALPSVAGAQAGAAAAAAARHAQAAAGRRSEIDLAALWDVLVDEPQRHTLAGLASLALGSDDGVARSALARALQEDRTHFTRKADDFEPRTREHVDDTQRREAAESARARRREEFVERARAALRDGPLPPPRPAEALSDPHRDHIAQLVELAVVGDEASSRREAVSLLDDAGAPGGLSGERAFLLLRALGLFHDHENLFIHRFHLRTSFPAEVLESARQTAARAIDLEGRRDLRHLTAFTIDDERTTELDDALSVETPPQPGGEPAGAAVRLGIHIADPGCFTTAGDPVDREAMARAATYYFPEMKIPMMPSDVAEKAASLVAEEDRPALSFLVTLSPLGEVLASEIVPSVIRSRARLTYEQADSLLEEPSLPAREGAAREEIAAALSRLRPLCDALESARVADGAVVIRAAEVDIRVDEAATIVIRRIDDRGASRRLVAEAMILANRLAAQFCSARGIPAIYRRQAPPLEAGPATQAPTVSGAAAVPEEYDPVAVRLLRRRMRRGETSLTPAPHSGLGLPAYLQATSPIRRYQDLVVHRQIKAHLRGEPLPYDGEALARIAASTDEAERAAREAERGTDEYWILRHYEERIGREVEGVIVSADARRTEVELTDTLHAAHLAPRPDHQPGRRLKLTIEASRPRAGRLVLREPS